MPTLEQSARGAIVIRGARQNNLRGIDLDLELNQLHVVTGPSGSGKSSLAFDTIYAEGQRRYVETFSPYTRQFLERMDKPLADDILGIPPAIAIQQANRVRTTRSTVGTMTEINDYLKLLMPRVAHGFCPSCQREIVPDNAESIGSKISQELASRKILVTFGVPAPPGTGVADFFQFLNQQGFLRVTIQGQVCRTDEPDKVTRLGAIVNVIQDRLTVEKSSVGRLNEAVEQALRFGKGQLCAIDVDDQIEHRYSRGWHCPYCDIDIRPPSPGLFSFNNPIGACPVCRGFGRTIGIDLSRAMPDRRLSLAEGVIKAFQGSQMSECQRDLIRCALEREIDIHQSFEELPKADQDWVINGDRRNGKTAEQNWEEGGWYGLRGFFDWLESKTYKMHVRVFLSRYRAYTTCEECKGTRFKPETLNYKIEVGSADEKNSEEISSADGQPQTANRRRWLTLPELQLLAMTEFVERMRRVDAGSADATNHLLLEQIVTRGQYLIDVGLGYLTLDRASRTLSGGELQRVNLTTCLGASLVNTLFVLDEPSIGLHPRDIDRLIRVLQSLRDKGNTLLVVEHEEAVMRAADSLVEIGPGRGEAGGRLVYQGPLSRIASALPQSLTAAYLTGTKQIPTPTTRRKPHDFIEVVGAKENNLKNTNVRFPLGLFCCVTGVSGSGKSTLVEQVLYRNLMALKGHANEEAPGVCDRIIGAHLVDEVLLVDQSPLARTPRSTPAVYTGVFDRIRDLFAASPEAKAAGLTPGAFSFNSGNGRCERCGGLGYEKVEMQFLSDQYIRCVECEGKRYQPHILAIRVAEKSIHDALELTVTEAIGFFGERGNQENILGPLRLLEKVGLGYLRLGQPVNVLSGGESQRLKLVGHLTESARNQREALLIFDEPTSGLHFDDIAALLSVFNELVERGNTVLVIEHNLDVIRAADYIIDLGPEAGATGGTVVATGSPEEVAKIGESLTGRFLRSALNVQRSPGQELGRLQEPAPDFGTRSRAGDGSISVVGARQHNLKNISVRIPREQMVVVTGLSGSGKSSLAFDILFAEGQRRFLDSMSTYARQFVEQMERPDVDHVEGLPPSVAIEQRVTRGGGKSTVATVTEVYHFLRLLFAKLGTQYCPKCNVAVAKQSLSVITRQVRTVLEAVNATLTAPVIKARKGYHKEIAAWAAREGYSELFVDGKRCSVDAFPSLERFKEHSIDVVITNFSRGETGDVSKWVKTALKIGSGSAFLLPAGKPRLVLSSEMSCPVCGTAYEALDPRLFSFNSPHGWCETCHGFGRLLPFSAEDDDKAESVLEAELRVEERSDSLDQNELRLCPSCEGSRLNPVARHVRIGGLTIEDVVRQSVHVAQDILGDLKFPSASRAISDPIMAEIRQRLIFMQRVGLQYLALDRSAKALSGGESQRIRLAAQLGSNLRGVLYVLDEPTIGLHPRDNVRLLDTLTALKQKGNSLVVVEHDEETMRRADLILDLGPGAGRRGGEVIASGPIDLIENTGQSLTGQFLREGMTHPSRDRRPLNHVPWLSLQGANLHNLKNVTVDFPIGRLTVITGVSGSGKSSLMRGVLLPAVKAALARPKEKAKNATQPWKKLSGAEYLSAVYEVDQSPIGKTSRSIPATYMKVFDEIRKLFAQLPESRIRGFDASRFSFNNDGGRCELCAGQGIIKLEMNFLPPTYVPCEGCHGKRFNPQTLSVRYNQKSIGDVLEMPIEEAAEFFRTQPKIYYPLELMAQTGLGYLQLGQPSPTLSGGEAQRLKLVNELRTGVGKDRTERIRHNRAPKSSLYLLEEPTIGLHMADVKLLVDVLHRLVDDGNTVIVIEHNLDMIAEADYVVDIGPEAGEDGGRVVAAGTPEDVSRNAESRTAPFLRTALLPRKARKRTRRRKGSRNDATLKLEV